MDAPFAARDCPPLRPSAQTAGCLEYAIKSSGRILRKTRDRCRDIVQGTRWMPPTHTNRA